MQSKKKGNAQRVNDLLNISEGKGDKRNLIDLIIFVECVEIFELLFFKDEILVPIYFRAHRWKVERLRHRNVI